MATAERAEQEKARVRSFWEADPCGAEHADAPEGTPEFFADVERKRDKLEPFIARFADFPMTRGQRALQIGVGAGTDFIRFVRAGAVATRVDLTEHAVRLGGRRLADEGLHAALRRAAGGAARGRGREGPSGAAAGAGSGWAWSPGGASCPVARWAVLRGRRYTGRAASGPFRGRRPGGSVGLE